MWADRWPGLADTSAEWLAAVPERLADADRRAERILATPLAGQGSLLRLGWLLGSAGVSLAPAAARRDGKDVVRAIADAALRGGPTFVKLGQFISSTRGLVPDWVADAFAGCRDEVPAAPSAAVATTLRRSGALDRLRSWDRTPIASASVAQVHAAVLDDGSDVVVKIRRPGIVRTVALDTGYLLAGLRLIESASPLMRSANLAATYELVVRLFAQEVDFRLEAANAAELALAFERAGLPVRVPAPVPGLVTKRVLVMERLAGVASDDPRAPEYGHDGADLVRLAATATVETTMVDGVFHGDLHPANVFVGPEGLGLVDFGIVGRFDAERRAALARLMLAMAMRDQRAMVEAFQVLGAIPRDADVDEVLAVLPPPLTDAEIARLMSDRRAMADRLAHMQRVILSHGFKAVPELTLFAKNLVYLGDAIERHAPELDPSAEFMRAAFDFQRRHGHTPD